MEREGDSEREGDRERKRETFLQAHSANGNNGWKRARPEPRT